MKTNEKIIMEEYFHFPKSMIINQEEILKDYKIDQIIIPGDIIEFKNEDQIPCDAILLKGYFY